MAKELMKHREDIDLGWHGNTKATVRIKRVIDLLLYPKTCLVRPFTRMVHGSWFQSSTVGNTNCRVIIALQIVNDLMNSHTHN